MGLFSKLRGWLGGGKALAEIQREGGWDVLGGISTKGWTRADGLWQEYSQVDLNVSYQYSEELSVFMEGLNLTDETTRSFSRYDGALQNATELGSRFNMGVRYTF